MYLSRHQSAAGPRWALEGRYLPAGLHAGALETECGRSKLPGGSGFRRTGRRPALAAGRAGTRGLGQRVTYLQQGGPRAGRRTPTPTRKSTTPSGPSSSSRLGVAGRGTRGQGAHPRRQPLERARARASPGCQQRDGDRRLHRGQRRVLAGHRGREHTVSSAGQGLRRRLLLGPGIVLSDPDAMRDLRITMSIRRGDAIVFEDETDTSQMKRSPRSLRPIWARSSPSLAGPS